MSLRSLIFVAGSASFLIGCGGGEKFPVETLVPVGGTLLVDGQPMDGVVVTFIPEIRDKLRGGGSGKTDDAGAFTITHERQNQPGLAPGSYTVAYSRMRTPDGSAVPERAKGEEEDPANIPNETFPSHLRTPDPKNKAHQVDIPEDGNSDLQLKASTKAPAANP